MIKQLAIKKVFRLNGSESWMSFLPYLFTKYPRISYKDDDDFVGLKLVQPIENGFLKL